MAAPDPRTVPVLAADVASHRFSPARKGYAPREVDDYLARVAERLNRLEGELAWQRARTEHLERRVAAAQESAYARLSRDFTEVVRRADEAASRVRLAAEARAAEGLEAAREEAERLVAEARSRARALTQDAERVAAPEAAPLEAPSEPVPDPADWDLESLWALAEGAPAPPESGPSLAGARPADPTADDPFDELELSLDPSLFDLFDDPEHG